MLKKSFAFMLFAGSLAGCDAATEIAGEAVESEVRNQVAAQCEQVAGNAGIVAGRVAEVCQCSADTLMADSNLALGDVTREKVEGIVNACAVRTGAASANSTETVPTEANNGW